MQFASGPQAQRFADAPIERLASQRTRLDGAVAWFDCELHACIAAGDHDILIGRVLDFGSLSAGALPGAQGGAGLIYAQRQFGVMQAVPR
jgi:3-hydroxy-9,10-secoandrosta-1,3,5(10)-triene-9,17-dione monooxygenase reductase component